MTPRQRVLAALRNEETDRVPLTVYSGLLGSDDDVKALLGDHVTLIIWASAHRTEFRKSTFRSEKSTEHGEELQRNYIETPVGTIHRNYRFDPTYHSTWAVDSYIRKPEDWDVLRFMFEDAVYTPDYEPWLQRKAQWGESGVQNTAVGRTPFQSLAYEYVGVQQLSLDYYDYPEKVQGVLDIMLERQNELDKIYAESPAEVINFPDNITSIVVGRDRFQKYCMPRYRHMAKALEGTGKLLVAHMDGMLKNLADLIADSPLTSLEAFTPTPDSDVSVAEARKLWPGKQLWINYPSSVHLFSPDVIQKQTRKILDEAAPVKGFLIGVTENVPPTVWRQSMATIDKAIGDFHACNSRT